jgi:tetratricopeptide (TPR) repeat protein
MADHRMSKLRKRNRETSAVHYAARTILFCLLLIFQIGSSAAQSANSKTTEIRNHLQRARVALKANASQSAVNELQAVLVLDPQNVEAHFNLGSIAFFQGHYREASTELRQALAIQPSLEKAQGLLGISEKRLGNPAARALLEEAFSKIQDNAVRKQVGLELAGMYYQEADLDGTASVMRTLVNIDPDNADVLFMAQRIYSELADDTLNKLAVIAPDSARMQQVIAERLVNAGDLQAAIEHYRKALEITPSLPGVHFELAEAILESSPADAQAQADAEHELETAVKLEGDSAKTECEFGRIAVLRSDTESALGRYHRAFALNPNDPAAQLGLGRVLTTMEKPEEAMKYLQMAVQSDPLNSEAHYRLARIYRTLEKTDEAEKEMRLFQEIKQTKNRVKELYRQMKKRTASQDDEMSEPAP